jgi:hypothetical protein
MPPPPIVRCCEPGCRVTSNAADFWVYQHNSIHDSSLRVLFGVCFDHRSQHAVSANLSQLVRYTHRGVLVEVSAQLPERRTPLAPLFSRRAPVAAPTMRAPPVARPAPPPPPPPVSRPAPVAPPVAPPVARPAPVAPRRPPLKNDTCPITGDLIIDPVVTSANDGTVYERAAIQKWFDLGHYTSPASMIRVPNLGLRPPW